MSYYRSGYIVLLFQYRCSEPLVLGLINTVIIINYFAWGQHSFFDIVIVTCECDVSKLQPLRSIVCQRYYYSFIDLSLYYFVVPFVMF